MGDGAEDTPDCVRAWDEPAIHVLDENIPDE